MGSTLASDLQERLYMAARDGPVETIRALVKEGADVDLCDANGGTALHFAAHHGNFETVRVMLELGGNPLAQTTLGTTTPLHMAANAGHSEIVKLLVQEMGAVDLATQTADGGTPLHRAAAAGHVRTVKLLLELGSDVHALTKQGSSPLHAAAAGGNLATVKLLLESGANMHAQDNVGCRPLHTAVVYGQLDTVKLLLELGANMHALCNDEGTPLHAAAAYGQLDTVKLLVDMGSSVLARTTDGRTPLHFAEHKGHEAIVSFLRKNVNNKRRPKATSAPIVDPAAQAAAEVAAAEVAAAAMAALLIAEEEDQLQAPPSKQGNSNKARKHRNRKKATLTELNTGPEGHNDANASNVASSSGIRRDSVGKRDDMGRDAARHSEPDGEMDVHGGEENAVPAIFDNSGQGHNEPEDSIGRNVHLVEASSVQCQAGTSHSGVEQPTTTQVERQQQKERERKGKQKQRKRATTRATLEEAHATLEKALARVDTAGASLDTLNALDTAIVSAKRIHERGGASSSPDASVVSLCASSGLLELLRQAEEKSLHLSREQFRAMTRAAENGNTSRAGDSVRPEAETLTNLCRICMDDDCVINTLFLPCCHRVACLLCARKLDHCPICRARVDSFLKTFDG
jgi:ankyrin repeat protein